MTKAIILSNVSQTAEHLAQTVARFATDALREELNTSVKFGLVCPTHNGSHDDLSFELMTKSINSLQDGFTQLVVAGFDFDGEPSPQLLSVARQIGLESQRAMFSSTNGCNTHKGALFCIGLFCVAIGWLVGHGFDCDAKKSSKIIEQICKGICNEELKNSSADATHGQKVFAKYSALGARGNAENGFCVAVEDFLPIWEALKVKTTDEDLAKTKLLAYIVTKTEDTNILYRAGKEVLSEAQTKCRDLYQNFNRQNAEATERWFIEKNISCGGSADMLGLTLFLDKLDGLQKTKNNGFCKKLQKQSK